MHRKPKTGHKIQVVDHKYIKDRAPQFEKAIKEAFKDSKFIDPYVDAEHIIDASLYFSPKLVGHNKHVVAMDEKGEITGACFHVPAKKRGGIAVDGMGWFFTSPKLSRTERTRLADEIFDNVHETMKGAGIKTALTTIGTKAGENFLQRRQGYVRANRAQLPNDPFWTREL